MGESSLTEGNSDPFASLIAERNSKEVKKKKLYPHGDPPKFKELGDGCVEILGRKCRFVGAIGKFDYQAQKECTWDDPENLLGEWAPLPGYEEKYAIAPCKYNWLKKEIRPGFVIRTDLELQLYEVLS